MMLYTPRTLFPLADDGFLPRPLAAVHAEYHTPHVAIAIQAVVVCVIAVTGTYVRLALMADVALLIVYLACCVGEGRLRQLNGRSEGEPFLMPAGRVVPWLAAALIIGLLARATTEAWLLTAAVVVLASLLFGARRGWGRHRAT